MDNNSFETRLTLILVVALGAGCSVQPLDPYQTGTGGVTGTGGFTDTGGFTGAGGNSGVAVVGDWYAFGDGVGPNAGVVADAGTDYADSDCVKNGGFSPESCTQITTPTPGQPFVPTDYATNKYCTYGQAAMVQNKNGTPDYADLWGGGIGLNFNPAGDGGAAGYADLSAYAGVEFDFSGNLIPPQSMRVDFPFLGQHGGDAPYWMGNVSQRLAAPEAWPHRDQVGRRRRPVLPDGRGPPDRCRAVPVRSQGRPGDSVPGIHQRNRDDPLQLLRRQPRVLAELAADADQRFPRRT